MKTMQQRWEDYLATFYLQGTSQDQRKQLFAAFFAGALSVLDAANDISDATTNDLQFARQFQAIYSEIHATVKQFTAVIKARN